MAAPVSRPSLLPQSPLLEEEEGADAETPLMDRQAAEAPVEAPAGVEAPPAEAAPLPRSPDLILLDDIDD